MRTVCIVLALSALCGRVQGQRFRSWDPFSVGTVFFTVAADTTRWVDGYRLGPAVARGGDTAWAAAPVVGNQFRYGNWLDYGGFPQVDSAYSLVGSEVVWQPARQAYRLVLSSGCSPHCFVQDTAYLYPAAGPGQLAFERQNLFGPGPEAFVVQRTYTAQVLGQADSVKQIGPPGGDAWFLLSRGHGLLGARRLFNRDTVMRRLAGPALPDSLPLVGALAWMDLRPGDRLDFRHTTENTGHGQIFYMADETTRLINRAVWRADSSQVDLYFTDFTAHSESVACQGCPVSGSYSQSQRTDSLTLRRADYAFAERALFYPYREGRTLQHTPAGGWRWAGPLSRQYPGNFDSTYGSSVSSFPAIYSSLSHVYVHMSTARHGVWGTPLAAPTAARPLLPAILPAYPMPAHEAVTVPGAGQAAYTLLNATGGTAQQGYLTDNKLSRSGLPAGLYLLKALLPGNRVCYARIVFE